MLSYFANRECHKGDFNIPSWKVWNFISILYILLSYSPIAYVTITEILNFNDYGRVLYFLSIEVFAISTFIAILLLVGIFKTCCCIKCCYSDEY
jgi:hypothetical protein